MSTLPGSLGNIRKKLVVVGDGASGKTSLLIAYKDGTFSSDYVPTVFENSQVMVPVGGKVIELSLWDTAGQEDYDRLRPLSYPGTDVIVICYSVDSQTSLLNVSRKWFPELKRNCPDVPRILVGCKGDLRGSDGDMVERGQENRQLTTKKDVDDCAKEIGAVSQIECSALEMSNIAMVFEKAARASLAIKSSGDSSEHSLNITNSNTSIINNQLSLHNLSTAKNNISLSNNNMATTPIDSASRKCCHGKCTIF